MRYVAFLTVMSLVVVGFSSAAEKSKDEAAKGPLRKLPANPRYFTDGSGKAVYLTGSHSWTNLQDGGWATDDKWTNNLGKFDYPGYLSLMRRDNQNFIRLWTPENAADLGHGNPVDPVAYQRTGPGKALDGQPKFDVTKLNQVYFDRLRARVIAARDRGIYVGIMLFDTAGVGRYGNGNLLSWKGHPFHPENNVNGINGDPNGDGKGLETRTLTIPAVTAAQDAYVRKVIDSVNDLDNVLYEISNEEAPDSKDWQYRLIKLIKDYEAGKPKQHPVGMTAIWPGTNDVLFESPADWISPASMSPVPGQDYVNDPPASTLDKVVISDTDHLANNIQMPNRATHVWVWKSFLRGINPIYMDQLPELGGPLVAPISPHAEDVRKAMGHTRGYAEKMNLAAMTPQGDKSSTAYCLAHEGSEYLVYQPKSGAFTVNLPEGNYSVEWFNPRSGASSAGKAVNGGSNVRFTPHFDGDAVLYLKSGASPGPSK